MRCFLNFVCLILSLVFAASAEAQKPARRQVVDGKIEQVNSKSMQAIADLNAGHEDIQAGAELEIRVSETESCTGRVTQRKENRILIDISGCPDLSLITPGAKLLLGGTVPATDEGNDDDLISHPGAKAGTERKIFFAVGGFYSMADKIKFDSVSVSGFGINSSSSLSYGTDYSPGILADVLYSARNQWWGAQAGVSYDFDRKIKTQDSTTNGVSTSASVAGNATISLAVVYLNALVRFHDFYGVAGANYSAVTYSNPPALLNGISGGLGGQAGIGFLFGDHLEFEALYRAVSLTVSNATISGITYGFGPAWVSGPQFAAKYLF